MSRSSAILLASVGVILVGVSPAPAEPPAFPVPKNAIARLGTPSFRHDTKIQALAYSPNSKILASSADRFSLVRGEATTVRNKAGDYDSYIRLWDTATGKELRRWEGHQLMTSSLAFSPDGKVLAAAGGGLGTVRLWDVATGKMLREIEHPGGLTVTFSPDGKTLAVLCGAKPVGFYLYDVETAKVVRRFVPPGEGHHFCGPAFSPDGKVLAGARRSNPQTGAPDTVYLWDVATGQLLHSCEQQPGGFVCTLSFCPDSKVVASGGRDGMIRLWDAGTGRAVRTTQTKSGAVETVAFSRDGKLLASTGPERTVLWDVTSGKEVRQLGERFCGGQACAFSPDGETVACTARNAIRLYRVATGEELTPPDGHSRPVENVAFGPGGKSVLTVGGTAWLWDVATGKGQPLMRGELLANCGSFCPDGRTVVLGSREQQAIRLWDVASRKEVRPFVGNVGRVEFVQFLPDGKIVMSMNTRRYGGEEINEKIRLWDVVTGKEERTMGDISIKNVALSLDGRVAVAWNGGSVTAWEMPAGRRLLHVNGKIPPAAAVTPDGRRVVAAVTGGQDHDLRLYEVASGRDIGQIAPLPGEVFVVALSPDGRLVAAGGKDHAVRVWEIESGKELRCLRGHHGTVVSLAFSPDGKRLVSGSTDTTAIVWDLGGLPPPEQPRSARLADGELKGLWADLAGEAPKAIAAIGRLSQDREKVVPFVEKNLRAVPLLDAQKFAQLIADLDSDNFAERERATAELIQLGNRARGALLQVLQNRPSAEAVRRIEDILSKLPSSVPAAPEFLQPTPELLRILRSIEILERIGTAEARQMIESLAKSAADPQVAGDAKATLERLQKRAAAKP